jgi:hypothetical protein
VETLHLQSHSAQVILNAVSGRVLCLWKLPAYTYLGDTSVYSIRHHGTSGLGFGIAASVADASNVNAALRSTHTERIGRNSREVSRLKR